MEENQYISTDDRYHGGAIETIVESISGFLSLKDIIPLISKSGADPTFSYPSNERSRRCGKIRAPEFTGEEDDAAGVTIPAHMTFDHSGSSENEVSRCQVFRKSFKTDRDGAKHKSLFSSIIITLKPPVNALEFVKNGALEILRNIPLSVLIQWFNQNMKKSISIVKSIGYFPLRVGHSVIRCIISSTQTILLIASRIWCEVRNMGVCELLLLASKMIDPQNKSTSSYEHDTCNGEFIKPKNKGKDETSDSSDSLLDFEFNLSSSGSSNFENIFGDGRINSTFLRKEVDLRDKLNLLNRTARVLSYKEIPNCDGPDNFLNTKNRVERMRRSMHYDISFKPFIATVAVDPHCISPSSNQSGSKGTSSIIFDGKILHVYTPQSFPPTPISRACVMSKSNQFSDNILFLARDQLRLDEQSQSVQSDETTRLTAKFLKSQARLAVLNGHAAAEGIALTCGHHCAVKRGMNQLYSSVRAMVPVLRNRYVFFQFSITAQDSVIPSLSLGLSTPDMPLNTLVGTWMNSIGLNSSGQMLVSSRWYSCVSDQSSYGVGSNIGVLVYLDGKSPFSTWNGESVTAYITYTINGCPVHSALKQSVNHISGTPSVNMHTTCLTTDDSGYQYTSTIPLAIPTNKDLFPTITLHSPNIQVFCRFCSADMVHKTRHQIGAPPCVAVYALDGSLVLNKDEDIHVDY